MPPYSPYPMNTTSPTMQHTQSTVAHGHKVVCAHPPQPYGSATSIDAGFGGSVGSVATSCNPLVSPMYGPGCPSSSGNPPPLRPHPCIPLPPLSRFDAVINPLLERGTTPQIKYDIRLPPSSATSRRHLVDDDRWRYEGVSNPNLGSLTIRMALVSKPIVVFPSNIDYGVAIRDVLLAVHNAVRASALDDQHGRMRHRHGELWRQGAPRSYRPHDDYEAVDAGNMAASCYGWAGLTRSRTESDVWILMTT